MNDETLSLARAERESIKRFSAGIATSLSGKYCQEDINKLFVVCDNHQHAVLQAKSGHVFEARCEMETLTEIELPGDREISAVRCVSASPVLALIQWIEGDAERAIASIHDALRACVELATDFGHNYLTAKRIHLASNIARVKVSIGESEATLKLTENLLEVLSGNRGRWPFEGGSSLDLPLRSGENQILLNQLHRTSERALGKEVPNKSILSKRSVGSTDTLDPIIKAVQQAKAFGCFEGWLISSDAKLSGLWTEYRPDNVVSPDVGIKIHVSASTGSAGDVLAKSIPILVKLRVPFKHSPHLKQLSFLLSGRGGLTQIGKFLTAYPNSFEVAKELAQLLHEATKGLPGPKIQSEMAFAPKSLVHYRYGSFSRQRLQLPTGRIVPALKMADGSLEIDDRSKSTLDKSGQFLSEDSLDNSKHTNTLRDKYVRIQSLHRGPKGSTSLGFGDAHEHKGILVIKEAYAYVMETSDGLDAKLRLRQEATCMVDLGATGITPLFVDYWEEEKSSFLVYELIEGPTFSSILKALRAEGLRPQNTLLHQWAKALCRSVSILHQSGYVIGDIKPDNLIFDGTNFKIIDLELAGKPTNLPASSMGTRGYRSPQQSDPNSGRSFQNDIYSVGATLLSAATSNEASLMPNPLVVTQIESGRDSINSIYPIIEGCLSEELDRRFKSIEELSDRISKINTPAARSNKYASHSVDFMKLSCCIADILVDGAMRDKKFAYWISEHLVVGGLPARDLYAGSAGTALFLCALFRTTRKSAYLETALQCGRWLSTTKATIPTKVSMPGLYYGICGQGFLYLNLYLATGDEDWLTLAISISEQVVRIPAHSPDIMTGSAGTGLYHLALWSVTRDKTVLDRALDIAHHLLETRSPTGFTWEIPPTNGSLSGHKYIGFSHGSAGIGYFLAECGIAMNESEITSTVIDLADWIIDLGKPCLLDGSGLTWGTTVNDVPLLIDWCHGAPGIIKFLLKAYELSENGKYLHAAEQAGTLVASGTSWRGTTQCHGLAGNLEVLLDIYQKTESKFYLNASRQLGEELAVYQTEKGWPSENPMVVCPDLMVGQAGVGAAFLRLSQPELPHLISIPKPVKNKKSGSRDKVI